MSNWDFQCIGPLEYWLQCPTVNFSKYNVLGDITPMNPLEIGVYMITVLLGLNIFAMALSYLWEVIENITV